MTHTVLEIEHKVLWCGKMEILLTYKDQRCHPGQIYYQRVCGNRNRMVKHWSQQVAYRLH